MQWSHHYYSNNTLQSEKLNNNTTGKKFSLDDPTSIWRDFCELLDISPCAVQTSYVLGQGLKKINFI